MNLQKFRQIVDQTSARIADYQNDPARQYSYVGLNHQDSYQRSAVSEALYDQIRNAFTSGHGEVWYICQNLKTDLIREHVIRGLPLDPYFEVLSHAQDALRARANATGEVAGDWCAAIQAARDHIEISNFRTSNHRLTYARQFAISEAARFLDQQGYDLRLEPGFIGLEASAEKSLVKKIEKLIDQLGGINVIQSIFAEISPLYDTSLQRYQLVPHVSMMGGGTPQKPWGYLLQLAIKHIDTPSKHSDFDKRWQQLLNLATAYAAVVDVQTYTSSAFMSFDAKRLLKFLQDQALYDSIFRFPQLRSSDILKLCRGALSFLDFQKHTYGGWTLNQAYEVIGYLIGPTHDVRGPVTVCEEEVSRALPHIPREVVAILLRDVLAHPREGPNQKFSRPTDVPTPEDVSKGVDFYQKPLVLYPGNRYLIVDRSICSWGYLEALLTALRRSDKRLDEKVGLSIERFLKDELASHGIPTVSGKYDLNGKHGECDVVAITPQTLIFMEIKKKPLTRRARAGSDADLLLDLAGSLLAAQAQAGWHELRLTNAGSLNLVSNVRSQTLSLQGRGIEKIAVGMLDFGSFQDRIMLQQFMKATLNAEFGSPNPAYAKRFKAINDALGEIREQYAIAHQGESEIQPPFFNCWFMSIPQLLVMLDEVADAYTFREALWNCRSMTTGTSDLYFEISNRRRLKASGG